ncbi:MAG TPA: N-acetylneuraminate synthase [Candidatus Limnocylindrales bacterium]|nr:N-acetylneuraminate synthase [Candidatus Limnocylindrales bacterium]
MGSISINGRVIGDEQAPYLIAEGGVNHNGSPDLALRLVDAAADAGADAVKFQTFHADALATADAPQAAYQRQRAAAASQAEMLRALELPAEALRSCRDRANERGITFLSTPFDLASVELLAEIGVPAFKVGSGDLTNLVLLRAVAARGLPMLVSTGMGSMDEVSAAVADIRAHGNPPLALLQCTSAYPAAAADANLRAMATLRDAFDVPVGYSDHTLGITVAVAAAALGAALIEKHLTLDRSMPGPDHAAALEPGELAALVRAVRDAHAGLGDGVKAPRSDEEDSRQVSRRSLVLSRPLRAGDEIAADDLDAMRPAGGISPLQLDKVVGRRAARDLAARAVLRAEDLDPPL